MADTTALPAFPLSAQDRSRPAQHPGRSVPGGSVPGGSVPGGAPTARTLRRDLPTPRRMPRRSETRSWTAKAGLPGRDPQGLSIVAVVPLFNGAAFIEQAILSILTQTHRPDEIVVVDDGSEDAGPDIVRRLARDYPVIRLIQQPNGGQSSARNLGVARSSGALIAFLDQDDAWYPDHLSELLRPFRALPTGIPLGWVYSELDRVAEDATIVTRALLRHVPVSHPKLSLGDCLGGDMHVLPSASLISREAFESVGGFDERLMGYEDDDLFLRLFRQGYGNLFIDRPLSLWRRHATSCSVSARMARSRAIYVDKLLAAFPDDPANNRYFASTRIAPRFLRNLVARYLAAARDGDLQEVAQTARDLAQIERHLPGHLAVCASALRVVMAVPRLGRAVAALAGLARSLRAEARRPVSAPPSRSANPRAEAFGSPVSGLLAG